MEPSLTRTLAAVSIGIAFDLASNGRHPGLSLPVLILIAVLLVRATSSRSRERDAMLAGAFALSWLPAIRAEDAIASPAVLAIGGLLVLAATGPGADRLTMRSALGRAAGAARALLRSPAFLAAPATAGLGDGAGARLRAAARASAVALPVVVVFAALLASADRVFADTLVPDVALRLGTVLGHVTLTAMGTWIAGAWWPSETLAIASTPAPRAPRESRLGPTEWTAALSGLVAVFALFVMIQLAFLFGGRGRVEVTPGLTYAEYARSGFFQLLAAGVLTALVLLGAWDHGRRDTAAHHRRFTVLSAALTALCLVVLASAAMRLSLYQQAFGFTIARLAAWFAIGATGAALCGLLAAIATHRRHRVLPGALAIAVASMLAAAVVSPSAFVAARNIERFQRTGTIDLATMTTLGPEAAPALVALIPRLTAPDGAALRQWICDAWSDPPPGWQSWNLARHRAAGAAATLDCR